MTGDYSDVRGVCHNPRKGMSREETERRLDYAVRLNLNSVRFWMEQEEWEKDPAAYEEMIVEFVRSCGKKGISVMPILWNGNFITAYEEATEAEWEGKRRYAQRMIELLKDEPAMLMWDVYNEPLCNDYLRLASGEEYEARKAKLVKDLRKHCELVRELDPDTPITVGHEQAAHLDTTADLIDVISFHDYLPTRKRMEEAYLAAIAVAKAEGGKPVLNTETGCIGRANPYDAELELCSQYHCGFYLFNLIIEGFWGEIHGIVYPDGTVRDPGIVAALYGFMRKRTPGRIAARGNREEHARMAVEAVEKALRMERKSLFVNQAGSVEELLEAAEYCINILESCELVPMWNPLSAQLADYRRRDPEEIDGYELQQFVYNLAKRLKEEFFLP